MVWLTDSRWLGFRMDGGWKGDGRGPGVGGQWSEVSVCECGGGGERWVWLCLSALLGSGAATALLTLEKMMIYDRSKSRPAQAQ